MRILVDRYIPYLKGVLEPYAEVEYLEPEEFTPARVADADALLVRTRTRCNEALLAGSRVRFIATATIGFDHIDTSYCEAHNIRWTNCPGCNAQGVCDYVEEVLATLYPHQAGYLGVVGVGHVGSLVAAMAARKGWQVLRYDPFTGEPNTIDEIAQKCHVITFHTPLTKSGEHPTYHMADRGFFERCRPDALIINAARGGVVDEQVLIDSGLKCVIDTWEGEPAINRALLDYAELASFHIAGYSLQGKINASNMCLRALSETFDLPLLEIDYTQVPESGDTAPGWLARLTEILKKNPDGFEELRETYKLR